MDRLRYTVDKTFQPSSLGKSVYHIANRKVPNGDADKKTRASNHSLSGVRPNALQMPSLGTGSGFTPRRASQPTLQESSCEQNARLGLCSVRYCLSEAAVNARCEHGMNRQAQRHFARELLWLSRRTVHRGAFDCRSRDIRMCLDVLTKRSHGRTARSPSSRVTWMCSQRSRTLVVFASSINEHKEASFPIVDSPTFYSQAVIRKVLITTRNAS